MWQPSVHSDVAFRSFGQEKDTYHSKQALWATMLVSYLAMAIEACSLKSPTIPAIDLPPVASRITLSIGHMHLAQASLELPSIIDDASRYARSCIRRATSKEIPITTASMWMTFRETPQGRRIVTVVATCIAAYPRVP